MRIGIDFRLLSAGGLTIHRGTGRYTQQQVREVLRLGAGHDLVLFCREDADFAALLPEIAASPRVSFATLPPLAGRPWHELNRPEDVLRATEELQRAIEAQALDVFHLTIPCHLEDLVALRLDGPVVATHYDLIPLLYPHHYLTEPAVRQLYDRALGLIRRADRVVAISRHVQREASAWLGLPAERIRVARPVADPVFRPLPEAERERLLAPLRRRLGLAEGFVLTVSHLHHAKNLWGLLSAWKLLPAAARREMPLVLACQLGPADVARVETWARELGIEADLRRTGLVTDEELAALYNAATLYVHPSRYEGFGLPVLEAMRCGAAVVAGNATSLPEVVGEAGVLFDPEDPAALARAIEELRTDAARRRELGEFAQERAAGFRAEDLGRETLAAYEEAAHAGRERPLSSKTVRLAVWTPVPPQESGIADYSLELLREVTRWADVEVFVDDGVLPDVEIAGLAPVRLFTAAARRHRCAPFDAALVQLGASFFHLYMKDALEGVSGIPVILTLHDLTWGALLHREATLLGEEEEFERALAASEGEAAAAEHAALMTGDPDDLPARVEGFLNRHLLLGGPVKASAAQIVHMPRAAADLKDRYAGARVFEFPMGVEDPRLSLAYTGWNDFRPRFGIPPGAFVAGTFGVAHPVKRLDTAVLALERLAADLPESDPILLIVGAFADPSYRRRLEDLAAELGMADRVRCLGRTSRRDFELALLACDAVVNLRYPFRHQMSATLMRAVAAGLPVVITDVPEWSHFPDSFCLRVAPDRAEVETLAGHLLALARDPARRRVMGEAARRFWEEQATPARMADGYRRVLSEVLGRRIEEHG
jgi:glycosyltransferase involved in cell wall biosynthesis